MIVALSSGELRQSNRRRRLSDGFLKRHLDQSHLDFVRQRPIMFSYGN